MSSLLLSPLQIGNVRLKNRICVSPMCQYVSGDDGFVNDWHLVHLGARASGGAGIVMMEATAVEKCGRMTARCNGIWSDAHIAPLKRVTDFIKSQNCVPAIQLSHSGRKGSTCLPWVAYERALAPEEGAWQTIAPSPIPFDDDYGPPPKEATLDDIQRLKASFVAAAKRAITAGFQILELHMAYGCLVAEFLSPYTNKRTDEYGGSFKNRIRFALELVSDVKAAIPPDTPLFILLCCEENLVPGMPQWDLDQAVKLAKKLKKRGVHLIDCTAGGNSSKHECAGLDQIRLAERIQREAGIPTSAVGGIISPLWAERILQKKKATLIFIGRASLDDDAWPRHAADELGDPRLDLPDPYKWAICEPWRSTELKHRNRQELLSDE